MKKLFRSVIAIGLVLAMSTGTIAFAAETKGILPEGGQAVLSSTAATGQTASKRNFSIPYMKQLNSKVLPVTLSFELAGATAKDTVHVLYHDGTAWELVASCPGNAINVTFTRLSGTVALVLESAAS